MDSVDLIDADSLDEGLHLYAWVNAELLIRKYKPDLDEVSLPLFDRMLSLMQTMVGGKGAVKHMIAIYARFLIGYCFIILSSMINPADSSIHRSSLWYHVTLMLRPAQ